MPVLTRFSGLVAAVFLTSTSAFADMCDYKPSKLMGEMASTVTATVGGGAAATGVGLKAAGYYTLVNAGSGMTMLGSTAAGASAAGTTGIIAGSAGVGATIASIVMAPVTIVLGAITVIGIGGFEGVCYFQIERVEDPFQVRRIVESIAANDPAVRVVESELGPRVILYRETGQENYLIRNLYIADGDLIHSDWFWNTNLGSVAYALPETEATR